MGRTRWDVAAFGVCATIASFVPMAVFFVAGAGVPFGPGASGGPWGWFTAAARFYAPAVVAMVLYARWRGASGAHSRASR